MTPFADHPAWDFVFRLYGQAGVAPACLQLQERHDINVTLMLFCVWRQTVDSKPPGLQMAALIAAARDWHEATVLPIRAARRWLKQRDDQVALYKAVKTVEIDCEHAELLMLAELADRLFGSPETGVPATASEHYSDAFLRHSDIRPDAEDQVALATILAAAQAIAAGSPQGPVT